MTLPFSITTGAANYVRDRLSVMPPEAEPALIMAERQGESLDARGEKTRWWYEGENFIVGYYDPSEQPKMESIDLLGHRVFIKPEAMQRLNGRTLSLQSVTVRYGWFWRKTRHVLVAVQLPRRSEPRDCGPLPCRRSVARGRWPGLLSWKRQTHAKTLRRQDE